MDFHLVKQLRNGAVESVERFCAESATQAIGKAESKYGNLLGGHVLYEVEERPVQRWVVARAE